MLVLGLVVWATGIFAGYAVLGRRRPLDAIFVTGLVLLLNMSLTALDQLHLLVLFSAAALLLLVRGHASDEVSLWLRDRLGDTGDVEAKTGDLRAVQADEDFRRPLEDVGVDGGIKYTGLGAFY